MPKRRNNAAALLPPGEEEQPNRVPSEKEVLAVQTLEGIRSVLENGRLSNEDCCRRIEKLIYLYYRELGIEISGPGRPN